MNITEEIQRAMNCLREAREAIESKPALEARIAELELANAVQANKLTAYHEDEGIWRSDFNRLIDEKSALTKERDEALFKLLVAEDKYEQSVVTMKAIRSLADSLADAIASEPAAQAGSLAATEPNSTSTTEADVQGPFVDTLDTKGSLFQDVNEKIAETTTDASGKPYAGHAPWHKPSHVTWGEFIDGGGEEPYWPYVHDAR